MDWTVDYGSGPRPCKVPHAWRQDVDVRWEGPAVYRTTVTVDEPDTWVVFEGVSYAATVAIDGTPVREHQGIWDAWAVAVPTGVREITVEVVKNGGPTFPVRDVLSGFLPYVFHTFGGIFRDVRLVVSREDPTRVDRPAPPSRIRVEGNRLFLDDRPWTVRGVLSWGWYPGLGHCHPSVDDVRKEVRRIKRAGFNLVKFCLWVPPHHFLDVLSEEGLVAWVELPLWMPSPEPERLEAMLAEAETIVRQYRRHDAIVAWTCGCELSESTPHEVRRRLFETVRDLTGCPLVKDNSGSAEMYGGDLREYGTFFDFHPYCDTVFYPPVLDSLQNGPRRAMPVLLGETNDYDEYRPLGRWSGPEAVTADPDRPWILEHVSTPRPYWLSSDPRLNDQGVRWQHDVPGVLDSLHSIPDASEERRLRLLSRQKSAAVRNRVTEDVAARADIAGFVVTGLVETPISTSGVVDQGEDAFEPQAFVWSSPVTFFSIPHRRPPWVDGGNRPGWLDPWCHFPGPAVIAIGARSDLDHFGTAVVRVGGTKVFESDIQITGGRPHEVARLEVEFGAGPVDLQIAFEPNGALWPLRVYERLSKDDLAGWTLSGTPFRHLDQPGRDGPSGLVTTGWDDAVRSCVHDERPVVAFLGEDRSVATVRAPFWRECVQTSRPPVPENDWTFLYPVATDAVLSREWLETELPGAEWFMTRVDTRTYGRSCYVAKRGHTVVTTLRPWGGLGAQPYGLENNPAGCELLRMLTKLAVQG
ncbi:MAG: hypothetical protein JST30_04175 [Armatimonadetes bacterium]|nr:hypothetical protein [Armatimonadota bacterium]